MSVLAKNYNRRKISFKKGSGSFLYATNGKKYLDFVQGWAVNTLGHCALEIKHALYTQSEQLINSSPAFYNAPCLKLAQRLASVSCFDRVFFTNSGAEANEGAIKLARKWGKVKRKDFDTGAVIKNDNKK